MLANVICRAQENGKRTPMGIAVAIDSAGLHMHPETAAELEALRLRVAELEAERHSTNEALVDITIAHRATEAEREKPAAEGEYPPVMPWALLMDADALTEFLVALANAICHSPLYGAVWEIEETCATWRATAEAKHANTTAPSSSAKEDVRPQVLKLRALLARQAGESS